MHDLKYRHHNEPNMLWIHNTHKHDNIHNQHKMNIINIIYIKYFSIHKLHIINLIDIIIIICIIKLCIPRKNQVLFNKLGTNYVLLCTFQGVQEPIRNTKCDFYLNGYNLSTYSVPKTHNTPNIYITATVTYDSRTVLPNSYLIIPNIPNYVQNRGFRHGLDGFFSPAKSGFKVSILQTPNTHLKNT